MSREPLSAIALWRLPPGSTAAAALSSGAAAAGQQPGGPEVYAYCAGTGGALRVLRASAAAASQGFGGSSGSSYSLGAPHSSTVVRSAQLEGDLLCLAPLHSLAGTAPTAQPTASFPPARARAPAGAHPGAAGGDTWGALAAAAQPAQQLLHPLLLAGAHNRKLYAYSVEAGRVVGGFEPHDDAVCCIALPGGAGAGAAPPARFFTASWDCSVKVCCVCVCVYMCVCVCTCV